MNMSTPITRRFLIAYRRIVLVGTIVASLLYSLFVLFPAYSSGIYRLSETQIERFTIDIPMIEQSEVAFFLLIFSSVAIFIIIPLQFINLLTLLSRRDGLSIEQKVFWLVMTIELWLMLYVTRPAASAIAMWAID
jgi:hypothetical protein